MSYNSTRVVRVEDGGTYPVGSSLSTAEIKRQLAQLTGQPWINSATVCENADGSIDLKRPAAQPKG